MNEKKLQNGIHPKIHPFQGSPFFRETTLKKKNYISRDIQMSQDFDRTEYFSQPFKNNPFSHLMKYGPLVDRL